MKISKVSLAVVFGAALATGALAQQHHEAPKQDRPAPAPRVQSAPAPRVQHFQPRVEARPQPVTRFQQPAPQYQPRVDVRQQTPRFTPAPQPTRTYTQARTQPEPQRTQRISWSSTPSYTNHHDATLPTQDQLRGHRDIGHVTDRGMNVQRFGWGDRNNVREGYEARDYREPSFRINFYLGAPTEECVPSPWYSYPTMPAYLPYDRVFVQDHASFAWDNGYLYNWNIGMNTELNDAIGEVSALFSARDMDAASGLVSPSGSVNIYGDGQYEYSLSGADFQQMLQDDAQNTQTLSFRVTSARVSGATAFITAAHTFQTPDGDTQTVYQEYRLFNSGGRYVLIDFSTSPTPL